MIFGAEFSRAITRRAIESASLAAEGRQAARRQDAGRPPREAPLIPNEIPLLRLKMLHYYAVGVDIAIAVPR